MVICNSVREKIKSIHRSILSRVGVVSRNDLAEAQSTIYDEFKLIHKVLPVLRTEIAELRNENDQLRSALYLARREAQSMAAVLRDDLRFLNKTIEPSNPGHRRKPPRVCFVLPYTYSLFNTSTSYIFGGSEVRAWILGRALARLGEIDVFFAVNDHGQAPLETWDNVRIYRATSLLSKLAPPHASIWPEGRPVDSLKIVDDVICEENLSYIINTDADLYCVFGVHNMAAEIVTLCRREGKPVALFIGSDDHLAARNVSDSNARDNYGNTAAYCYQTIAQADLIFAQTNRQAEMLRRRFGREAMVLPNPIDLNDSFQLSPRTSPPAPVCLWIGKSDQVKRPELLIELARQLPEFRFQMVMNISNPEIHDRVVSEAPANVQITERLSIDEIEALFRQASFLVNTSLFEGFPNTFLQAGKYGVPIISLAVDPDDFIQENGCGVVADGRLGAMAEALRSLTADARLYGQLSSRVCHYVKENHEPTRIARELNRILLGFHREKDRAESGRPRMLHPLEKDQTWRISGKGR